jgi:hypothetical protein
VTVVSLRAGAVACLRNASPDEFTQHINCAQHTIVQAGFVGLVLRKRKSLGIAFYEAYDGRCAVNAVVYEKTDAETA